MIRNRLDMAALDWRKIEIEVVQKSYKRFMGESIDKDDLFSWCFAGGKCG